MPREATCLRPCRNQHAPCVPADDLKAVDGIDGSRMFAGRVIDVPLTAALTGACIALPRTARR